MAILKPCLQCGQLSDQARCPTHRGNTSWAGNRDRATQARFRRDVLQRDGEQCTYITAGRRCTNTTHLQAHHIIPGNNDPNTGRMLCYTHHRLLDQHARGKAA